MPRLFIHAHPAFPRNLSEVQVDNYKVAVTQLIIELAVALRKVELIETVFQYN